MHDLVTFIHARLDEDEQTARAALADGDTWDTLPDGLIRFTDDNDAPLYSVGQAARVEHIARHNPARVLREVDMKRQIFDEVLCAWPLHDPTADTVWEALSPAAKSQLATLAMCWADHPDYRPE